MRLPKRRPGAGRRRSGLRSSGPPRPAQQQQRDGHACSRCLADEDHVSEVLYALLLSVANSVRREGAPWNPHDHSEVQTVVTVSDDTDGLDVTASSPAGFPRGMLVMMNARGRNFSSMTGGW
jgi:hypothetical protein